MKNNAYLLWLHWPESCFDLTASDLKAFRSYVPKGSRVTAVKTERAFLKALPGATHAIVWSFREEWFARAKNLRNLITPAAGHELLPENAPAGVRIAFGHFHGKIIAESVAGFMLAWAHGFFCGGVGKMKYEDYRIWMADRCYTISGTKALIVGYGHVGKAIGSQLEAFGVTVAGFGRKNIKNLPQAAKDADWIIFALPGTPETDNLLNAALIDRLPRRAVVINVGRGNCIDEVALKAALKTGKIAGAYLDVCKGEKSEIWANAAARRDESLIDPLDPKVPNLVVMPHSAAFTPSYLAASFKGMKDDGVI